MLTEKARAASARKWLHELAKLIYSMIIWSGNHATQATLTDSEKEKEEAKLLRHLRSVAKVCLAPLGGGGGRLTHARSTLTTPPINSRAT